MGRPRSRDLVALLLGACGGLIVIGCGIYCLGWYRPAETAFWNPDVALTCWLYCSTLDPLWGIATLISGALPLLGGVLIFTKARRLGALIFLISGIATLPIGLLSLIAGYLVVGESRVENRESSSAGCG